MTSASAALLAYRVQDDGVWVFLGHMGGPFWARRDRGAWSIPKGEYDPATEDPLEAALREFAEEIGVPAPQGQPIELGRWQQRGGKRVHAFAVAAEPTLAFRASNTFTLEWPPGSGQQRQFPEIDRARWFTVAAANQKVIAGQVPILAALERIVGSPSEELRES